ncbi:MAG: rod-binding protein [Candidatus Eisenbacteria bacterium]
MSPDGIHTSRAVAADPHVQLRKMAHAMEGLFLNQLFQAMRASVPTAGGEDAPAQEMFTSLFDQQIAALSAEQQSRGLGEALYHQLARRLDAAGSPPEQKGL